MWTAFLSESPVRVFSSGCRCAGAVCLRCSTLGGFFTQTHTYLHTHIRSHTHLYIHKPSKPHLESYVGTGLSCRSIRRHCCALNNNQTEGKLSRLNRNDSLSELTQLTASQALSIPPFRSGSGTVAPEHSNPLNRLQPLEMSCFTTNQPNVSRHKQAATSCYSKLKIKKNQSIYIYIPTVLFMNGDTPLHDGGMALDVFVRNEENPLHAIIVEELLHH